MKHRYFAYIRVSTVKQGERGSSLVEQRSAIEAYAARHALPVVEWFEEIETAAKQGRRKFSIMLRELRAHKADGLIIHKIDRSARNLRDWADLGDLIDQGVDVRFVTDNFDLLSRGGRLSADIQAVVAADYIRNLREEVRKGLYGRLKQGIYPFGAPMGYLNTGKGNLKRIDPVKGPLVRRLFERYASNTVGFEALRYEFMKLGLTTQVGRPLARNTLSDIFNNPFYTGIIRIQRTGELFNGAHEPLISKELFDRVQRILRGKTTPKARKHNFLLSRFVRCGGCERRTLTGETQKEITYYRCHNRSCVGVTWREDALEAHAREELGRIVLDEQGLGDLRDLVREQSATWEIDREQEKAGLELRLKQIEDRTARLSSLLLDGSIDQADYRSHKERLVLDRQSVTERLEYIQTCDPLQSLYAEFELKISKVLRYDSLIVPEKRELFETVGSNFVASPEKAAFTLRSPYREIANLEFSEPCAHERDDVRTRKIFDVLMAEAANREKEQAESDRSATKSLKSPSPRTGWQPADLDAAA